MIIKITKESGIPLIGTIQFGIIDRRSNLLQIRPTTICNLKCTFCSTAAGKEKHPIQYEVEYKYLIKWIKEIIKLKDCNEIEANIDSVGEPTTYPKLTELIKELKKIPEIEYISMQTNGTLLTKEKIKDLEKAGLNRINLSIHSLNKDLAKKLSGKESYKIEKIIKIAKIINPSKMELNITPIYLPTLNDEEIEKIILLAKDLDCKIGIQKYETYKYSRKEKSAKEQNWFKFYRKLSELEKKYNYKLKYGPLDYNIKRTKSLKKIFEKDEKVKIEIKLPGWYKNQMIGIAKDRCITIINCNSCINSVIKAKIISNDNNIYIAKKFDFPKLLNTHKIWDL